MFRKFSVFSVTFETSGKSQTGNSFLDMFLSLFVQSQPAWIHLRCIFETSHTESQRHLKEGWFENL